MSRRCGNPWARGAGTVLLAAACSAPRFPPPPRAQDAPGAEGASELAEAEHQREARREEFLARHGLRLSSTAASRLAALGSRVRVTFVLENLGSEPMLLAMRRRRGVWPFGHLERGRAVLTVESVEASAAAGFHRAVHSLSFPELEDLRLAPGGRQELEQEIALPEAVDYAELTLRACLFPLALQVGEAPECFLALPFPPLRLIGVPAAVAPLCDTPEQAVEAALADPARGLLAAAICWGAQDSIGAVDRLLGPVHDRTGLLARHLTTALRWITGEDLGPDLERWRGWWASGAGARWAQDQRRRRNP